MKRRRALAIGAAGIVLVLATLVWALVQSGKWAEWRSNSYLERAKRLRAAGSTEAAGRACARAIEVLPQNVSAYRFLLTVPTNNAAARLLVRSRIADLDPQDRENLYALAFESLPAGRDELSRKAIGDLEKAEGETTRVRELKARWYTATGETAAALPYARKLLAEKPDSEPYQLIVALGELQSPDANVAENARRTLERLTDKEPHRFPAARALCLDATKRADFSAALRWAKIVTNDTQAAFDDHLALADLTVKQDPSQTVDMADYLQKRIGNVPRHVLTLSRWLETIGRDDLLNDLLQREPAGSITTGIIRAQHLGRAKDWNGLRDIASKGPWGKAEALRLAYLARALKELELNTEAQFTWDKAIGEAAQNNTTAQALSGIVSEWADWTSEQEEFLWRIQTKSPSQLRWALLELFRIYNERRNSQGLMRVSQAMHDAVPSDEAISNNLAFLMLLRGNSGDRAHAMIEELRQRHPNDPIVASTCALSALRKNDPRKALEILKGLPDTFREGGSSSVCEALALAKTGDIESARKVAGRIDRTRLYDVEAQELSEAGL